MNTNIKQDSTDQSRPAIQSSQIRCKRCDELTQAITHLYSLVANDKIGHQKVESETCCGADAILESVVSRLSKIKWELDSLNRLVDLEKAEQDELQHLNAILFGIRLGKLRYARVARHEQAKGCGNEE